ncbi:MAG: hypothetical protein M3328_16595, partial [Chloroflexota bacterium]|nr:hypothetical protein [Chloroflexota bacterium]
MLSKKRSLSLLVVALLVALAAQLGGQIGVAPAGTASNTNTAAGAGENTPRLASTNYQPTEPGKADPAQKPFETGRSAKHDTSKPLREVPTGPAPQLTVPREMPEPRGAESSASKGGTRPQVTDPVVQNRFTGSTESMAALAAPAPTKNFPGLTNRNSVYPPDPSGDVGPNHYVQMVNSSIQIFDKNGNTLYGPTNNNTIWSGFGGACETRNDGDPVVLYDQLSDRFLVSQFTSANPYGECIAVSQSGDPTGPWHRYFFQFSTTVFYDYPHLGVWPDGYYMGANRFTSLYQGPVAVVFDRAKMLQGQPATYQAFNVSNAYGTLLPSDLDGSTLPPAGAPNVFAAKGNNALYLWKFSVNWTTPSSSTFTGPTALTTAAFNNLCTSGRSCVPQPGTNVGLDGVGDRLMFRLAYRNLGTHEALVATHSVNALSSGTQAAVRWYEIRNPAGAPTIYQQGTYAPDATHRWLSSIAMDGAGNIAMAYSASSSSVYPSIRYTGRLASDALGEMPQGETTLIAGSGSQTGTASRWGDYAQMSVDPTDDCTFWMTHEYMPTTGTAPWTTRIGAFKFDACGGTQPTPTSTPVVEPTATPVATATPVGCTEALTNGGFESGTAPWVQTSKGGYQIIANTRPRTGTMSAYLAGYDRANDTLYQQVTIPANATSATLTYYW